MQCSTTTDDKSISSFSIFNLHGQVPLQLSVKPISQIPTCHIFALQDRQTIHPYQCYIQTPVREEPKLKLQFCYKKSLVRTSHVVFITSRPAKGDVFTENDILTVGSSTVIVGSATPSILSANVSPICSTSKTRIKILPIVIQTFKQYCVLASSTVLDACRDRSC